MYIPVSYFGAGEGCITATGGITGSYVSGGVVWKYHKFDADNFTSSSFNVISGSTLRGKLLVVGGGGSGASGVDAAAGGGGGGIVYYDQFPIISGSYNLVVGRGGDPVYGSPGITPVANAGNNGRYSQVQTPFGPYTPFTSSLIIAWGGGGGGVAGAGVTASYGIIPGAGGASGGGNAQNNNGYAIPSSSNFDGDGFGGITLNDQGNFGGSIPADTIDFNTSFMVTGGGGAGASSLSVLDTGGSQGSPSKTNGGDGVQIDIDGVARWYGGGGASSSSVFGNSLPGKGADQGSELIPSGLGGGSNGYLGSGFTRSGSAGIVIFAYRLCPFSNDCNSYVVSASAAQATVTYIDCYTNVTTSAIINPYTTASICARPFDIYPYVSGYGAGLTTGSSCNSPITPTQCGYCIDSATGSVTTGSIQSSYTYTITFSGNLPTPPNYPAGGTVYYVNNNGISSSATYTYPSVGSNPLVICARPVPALSFTLQSGASVSVATGSVCANYCDSPYINTVNCEKYYGYSITRCGTTSSFNVKSYASASIGTIFSTNNGDYPWCYSITSTIPATRGQDLINFKSTYADCNTCTGSEGPFPILFYSANSLASYPGSGSKWYSIGLSGSTAANTLTGSFSYNGCSINLNTNTGSVEYSGSGYTNPSNFTYLLCISASAGYFKNLIDGNSSIIFNDSDNSVFFESGSGPLYTTTGTTPANQLGNSFTSSFNTLAFTRDSSNNMILRTSLDNFSGSYELSGSAAQKAGFSTGFNVTKLLAYKGFNIKSIKLYDSVLTTSQMLSQSNCANC